MSVIFCSSSSSSLLLSKINGAGWLGVWVLDVEVLRRCFGADGLVDLLIIWNNGVFLS